MIPRPKRPIELPKTFATVDEVNSTVQNCHCVSAAQYLALLEKLHEKGILDDEDGEAIYKRKLYWISQLDQMIAQAKEDAIKDAIRQFKKDSGI